MPIGAALAGSAIVGAGASIYSAGQQKKAASQAQEAADRAAQQQLAAQQAALDRVTQLEAPFQQGGALGETALLQRLGLIQPGTTATQPDPYYGYYPQGASPSQGLTDRATAVPGGLGPAPKTGNAGTSPAVPDVGQGVANSNPAPAGTSTQGQVPDWNAYLQANPDVLQWAQSGHGDPNIPIEQQSLQQRAAYQWAHEQQVYGTAPRPLTYVAPQAQPQQTAAGPERTDLMTADRPTPDAAPTFTRPDQGTAPDASQFFSNFTADPGYQFALQQGLRSANAGYAARGLLKSDSAIKGLNDYAQGQAAQQYGNWWNRQNQLYNTALNIFNSNRANANQNFENDRGYGTNLYLNQRDYTNNNFNQDRQYQTGRYDTNTGNLFQLAQMGQSAAGAVGGANQSFANNASNIYGSQANAAANAAYDRASANAGMAGSLAGTASNLFGSYASGAFGGGGGFPVQTVGDLKPVQFQNPFSPSGPMTTFKPPVF
jgi:hypothetical protein